MDRDALHAETTAWRRLIPTTVCIKGDCRGYRPEVSQAIEVEMRRVAVAVAAGYAATAEVSYAREFIPTINTPEQTAAAAVRVGRRVFGEAADGNCDPIMAPEDFARLLAHVPGCLVMLGNGGPGTPGAVPLHSPGYDFDDGVLPWGAPTSVHLPAIACQWRSPASGPRPRYRWRQTPNPLRWSSTVCSTRAPLLDTDPRHHISPKPVPSYASISSVARKLGFHQAMVASRIR